MVQAELMAGDAKRAYDSIASVYKRSLELRDNIRVSGLVSIYFPLVTQWVFEQCTWILYDYFAVGSLLVNPVGVVPETSVECLHRQLSLYTFAFT